MAEEYKPGDIVWARVGRFPWWPALVVAEEDVGIKQRPKPVAYVRYLGEPISWTKNSSRKRDIVKSRKQIQAYNSAMKEELIMRGIKDWKYSLAFQQAISVVGDFQKQKDKMSPKKAIQPDIQLINLPVDYGSLNKAAEKNEFLTVKSGHIFATESSCMNTSLDEYEFLSRNGTLNKENVVCEYDKLHTSKNNDECPTTNRTSMDDKRSVSKRTKNGTIFRTKFHISRQIHNNHNSPSMEIGIRRCSTGPVNQTLSRYSRKKRNFEYKSAADRLKNCNFPGDAVETVRSEKNTEKTTKNGNKRKKVFSEKPNQLCQISGGKMENDGNKFSAMTGDINIYDSRSNQESNNMNYSGSPGMNPFELQTPFVFCGNTSKPLSTLSVLDDSYLPTPDSKIYLRETTEVGNQLKDNKSVPFDPNIDMDEIDEADSDEDLPVGLSSLPLGNPVSEKDVVWLRWKRAPHWPVVVKKIYKKLGRLTVIFIRPNRRGEQLTISYNRHSIVPFNDPQKEEFMNAGMALNAEKKAEFMQSVELAEHYLTKRALGTLENDLSFIMACETPEVDIDTPVQMADVPLINENVTESREENKRRTRVTLKMISKKGLQRRDRLIKKNQKLVDVILSDDCKAYLLNILHEKKESMLHTIYKCGTSKERAKIKNQSFGPLDEETQMDSIIFTMNKWLKDSQMFDEVNTTSYVFDVWVPEAVVFGLKRLHSYGTKKAWEMFQKGVKYTKEELLHVHYSIISSVNE